MYRRPSLLILSEVRTGGTVLFGALGGHSQLRIAGEIFNFSPRNVRWGAEREVMAQSAGAAVPTRPRDDLVPLFRSLFERYNGFSLHRRGQISRANAAWQHLAQLEGLHVIHLYRQNTLEQYISDQLAEQSGVWHQQIAPDAPRPMWAPFAIDVHRCIQAMRGWNSEFDWALEVFQRQPRIVVSYEDIRDDMAAVLASCQAFLGIPVETLPVKYRQFPSKDLPNLILNFHELEKALSATEFEHCIGHVVA